MQDSVQGNVQDHQKIFLVHHVCNKNFFEIWLMAYELGHVVDFLSSLGLHDVGPLWKAVVRVLMVRKK